MKTKSKKKTKKSVKKVKPMDLQLDVFEALCSASIFIINGIDAEEEDFGEKYDRDKENAPDYGCGDMEFTRIDSTPEILEKYKISEEDYQKVCDRLESELSFGNCGWCT
jgi:hypothetical protein